MHLSLDDSAYTLLQRSRDLRVNDSPRVSLPILLVGAAPLIRLELQLLETIQDFSIASSVVSILLEADHQEEGNI